MGTFKFCYTIFKAYNLKKWFWKHPLVTLNACVIIAHHVAIIASEKAEGRILTDIKIIKDGVHKNPQDDKTHVYVSCKEILDSCIAAESPYEEEQQ